MDFVWPFLGLCAFGPRFEIIFNFDNNKGLRSSTKSASCGVIDIGNGMNTNRQSSCERFALTGYVEAVVWRE
jgi:hypothetical protein